MNTTTLTYEDGVTVTDYHDVMDIVMAELEAEGITLTIPTKGEDDARLSD
jgi:hypothetical protein